MAATLAHFLVRRLLLSTITVLLLPAAAQASPPDPLEPLDPAAVDATVFDTATGRAAPSSFAAEAAADDVFPIRGGREWGRGLSSGHKGIDLLAACGTPMVTPEGGRVVHADSEGSAGNYLVVRAPDGKDHVFMRLARPAKAKVGDRLERGDRIGSVGRTGNASTCHLHFEIWTAPGWYDGGAPRDPKPDLDRWAAS